MPYESHAGPVPASRSRPLKKFLLSLGAAAVALALAGPIAGSASAQTTLAGETVTLLIGFPPGSASDIFARQILPFIQKHLPGNPNVIVDSKAGAGGVLAANYLYSAAKPDGHTVGLLISVAEALAVESPAAQFDFARMPILGSQPINRAMLVHSSTGIKTADDLVNVTDPVLHGASGPQNTAYLSNSLFFDMLGIPHRALTGYQGQGAMQQALRSAEIEAAPLTWSLFLNTRASMESEGIMRGVWQMGSVTADGSVVADPAADIPTAHAIIQKHKPEAVGSPEYRALTAVHGALALGRIWALPPGTEQEMIDMWRAALAAAYADPEYMKISQEAGELPFQPPQGTQTLIDNLFASLRDPEVQAVLKRLLAPT